jgi:fungal STAND N-terminal Goodbye domain
MSASNQVAGPSTDSFLAIFNAASNEYLRVTGNRLETHPFAAQLVTCHSPEAVSNVLRSQAQAFSKFREGDEKLMIWLNPTINILLAFSGMLGEGIGLVSSLVHSFSQFLMTWFSAILSRENNLYRYRCSSRGRSL